MNWQAIGVIAEIIGVIAVLITLIYLSIQTRLTRIAVEETSEHAAQQATNAAQEMYSTWRRTVFDCPELPTVIVKARGSEPLNENEQILFSSYFDELFFTAVTSHRGVVHRTAGYTESIDVTHLLAHMNRNPKAIEEWRRVLPVVSGISSEFANAVERSLRKSDA